MALVGAFMESPLATWVQTFTVSREPVDFNDIADGVYLNDVMFQIDQRPREDDVKRSVKDNNCRIQNWQLLMKNITVYYQEVLQQLIVMELPNILAICQNPTHESSLLDIQKVILLLLGCAIQCDRKEDYVEIIKDMNLDVQAAIVEHIKQITDSTENVLPADMLPQMNSVGWNVRSLVRERDEYNQTLLRLAQESDYYRAEAEGKKGVNPPPNLEKYQLARELAESRNQIQSLQEDVDEKSKLLSELKHENEESRSVVLKLKAENLSLSKDAKAMRIYRDEIDMFREKAMKVEKYEKEILKYKEMLSELDFYKSRVEELREDNSVLIESKVKLEDMAQTNQRRLGTAMDDLARVQFHLEEVSTEKEKDRKQIQELIEENSTLQFEKSTMKEGLGRRHYGMRTFASGDSLNISTSQLNLSNNYHPISEELNDSVHSHMSRLEMENEELAQELKETKDRLNETLREIEKLKDRTSSQMQEKVSNAESKSQQEQRRSSAVFQQKLDELEHNNQDLNRRLDLIKHHNHELTNQMQALQEALDKERQQTRTLDKQNKDLVKEKEQSKLTIDRVCQDSQKRTVEMDKEVENLLHQIQNLQKNNNLYEQDVKNHNGTNSHNVSMDDCYDFEEIPDYHSNDPQLTSTPVKTKKGKRIHYKDPKYDTPPRSTRAPPSGESINSNSRQIISYVDPRFGSPPQYPSQGYRSDADNQSIDSQVSDTLSVQSSTSSKGVGKSMSALDKIKRSLSFKDKRRNIAPPPTSPLVTDTVLKSSSLRRSYSVRDKGERSGTLSSKPQTDAEDLAGPFRRSYSVRGDMHHPAHSTLQHNTAGLVGPLQRSYSVRDRSDRHKATVTDNMVTSAYDHIDPTPIDPAGEHFRRSYSLRDKGDRSRVVQHRDYNQISYERRRGQDDVRHTWSGAAGENGTELLSSQGGTASNRRHCSMYAAQDYKPLNTCIPQGQPLANDHGVLSNKQHHRLQERQSPDGSPTMSNSEHASSSSLSKHEDQLTDNDHFLTNIKVVSSETLKRILYSARDKPGQTGANSEKWKTFIDKIVILQDKNQELITDNSELRKRLNTLKFSEDRIKHLETANIKLESENRKLHKIIESLQGALSGKNPYDDREYHYFSNV